jgi:hypothetical protein
VEVRRPIEPMPARTVDRLPFAGYVFEPKLDGFRCLLSIDGQCGWFAFDRTWCPPMSRHPARPSTDGASQLFHAALSSQRRAGSIQLVSSTGNEIALPIRTITARLGRTSI